MIKVEDINSRDIKVVAEQYGITEIEVIADNGKSGDQNVTVYRVGDVLVADTNGDPMWQEEDAIAFAELVEAEGIEL